MTRFVRGRKCRCTTAMRIHHEPDLSRLQALPLHSPKWPQGSRLPWAAGHPVAAALTVHRAGRLCADGDGRPGQVDRQRCSARVPDARATLTLGITMKAIDLFAGAGGFSTGATMAVSGYGWEPK